MPAGNIQLFPTATLKKGGEKEKKWIFSWQLLCELMRSNNSHTENSFYPKLIQAMSVCSSRKPKHKLNIYLYNIRKSKEPYSR